MIVYVGSAVALSCLMLSLCLLAWTLPVPAMAAVVGCGIALFFLGRIWERL